MVGSSNSIKLFGVVINTESWMNLHKGRRWSEDEHKAFLVGLDKLGKGNWTGIAKHFVSSRTPTQVASHAQKYFDRQKEKRALKRHKSSVFDINLDKESSNTCVELVSKNKKKGKQVLNEESPISPMPISYRLPPNVPMANYSLNATPLVHGATSQSSSVSVDNLDLTL
ncbi:probable transcription factor At5g61620 [Solanum dulcamara]|uniref:probable transcription factor At5g61620 n=1 Tax=Solanum dulcamara TaxID=45834 RepID=UPI002485071D|nr:probable transcription factor At5g61620 [Solanum dulcamara]XP_055806937.1 probable transcription factor At5g61620 [Solanum dulcamara]